MCGKSDMPQARNTFHHYLGNGKMLDSGYDVSTANTIALLWKCSYTTMQMLEGSLQLITEQSNFGVQPYPKDLIFGCRLRKISTFLALLLSWYLNS